LSTLVKYCYIELTEMSAFIKKKNPGAEAPGGWEEETIKN
jgi:hypothetical protein